MQRSIKKTSKCAKMEGRREGRLKGLLEPAKEN
jgi:hypothetical protein